MLRIGCHARGHALTLAVPTEGNPAIRIGEREGGIFLIAKADGPSVVTVKYGTGRDRLRIRFDAAGEAKVETIVIDGNAAP